MENPILSGSFNQVVHLPQPRSIRRANNRTGENWQEQSIHETPQSASYTASSSPWSDYSQHEPANLGWRKEVKLCLLTCLSLIQNLSDLTEGDAGEEGRHDRCKEKTTVKRRQTHSCMYELSKQTRSRSLLQFWAAKMQLSLMKEEAMQRGWLIMSSWFKASRRCFCRSCNEVLLFVESPSQSNSPVDHGFP